MKLIISLIQNLVFFNSLENIFVVLFFCISNNLKLRNINITPHVLVLIGINASLSIFGYLLHIGFIIPVFGVIITACYFSFIFNVDIRKSLKTTFVAFMILLVCEMITYFVLNKFFHTNYNNTTNLYYKLLCTIPVRFLQFLCLYIYYKHKNLILKGGE